MPRKKDFEVDIHVWKKPESRSTNALYTISVEKRGICIDVPIDMAMKSLREYLEEDDR